MHNSLRTRSDGAQPVIVVVPLTMTLLDVAAPMSVVVALAMVCVADQLRAPVAVSPALATSALATAACNASISVFAAEKLLRTSAVSAAPAVGFGSRQSTMPLLNRPIGLGADNAALFVVNDRFGTFTMASICAGILHQLSDRLQ